MTDLIEDEAPALPERGMTAEEQRLADLLYGAIQAQTDNTARSLQSQSFVMGVSDLGMCSERTRRLMAAIPATGSTDKLEAFIGSWVGMGVEAAVAAAFGDHIRTQTEVTVALDGDQGHYEIVGHADLVHRWGVGDVKSTDGLEIPRRIGPSQQQLFQRHLLCLGLGQAGLLDVSLDDARTYNVWIDRSGRTKELHVHMDHFSWDVVAAATSWLDGVVYAYRNGQQADKEPPRAWCEKVCGHFADCRQFDTDVSGLIQDPTIATAAMLKLESSELTARANRLKKEANGALAGVNGYVTTEEGESFQIRNTWVNGSDVRRGYWKINVSPVKDKK